MRDDAPLADEERERFHERAISGEGSLAAERAVGALVADRRGMHARVVRHRGLEERAVELEQPVALARNAFGKESDAVALAQCGMHLVADERDRAPLAAADEERARFLGDPAGDGPVADLALGDEARRPHARDEEDVHPGDVVRGDHRAARVHRGHRAVDTRGDAEDAKHLARPPPDQRAATVERDAWKRRTQQERRNRGVPQHARPADEAYRTARESNA